MIQTGASFRHELPVPATAWEDGERTTLAHLDSRRFLARLPDRDTLIDGRSPSWHRSTCAGSRRRYPSRSSFGGSRASGGGRRRFLCAGRGSFTDRGLSDDPALGRDEPVPYSEPLPRAALMPARYGSPASMDSMRRRPVRRSGGSSPGAWGTPSSMPTRSMPATGCTVT